MPWIWPRCPFCHEEARILDAAATWESEVVEILRANGVDAGGALWVPIVCLRCHEVEVIDLDTPPDPGCAVVGWTMQGLVIHMPPTVTYVEEDLR